MWQKMMRTWLVGATASVATPEDAPHRSHKDFGGEPALSDLLEDPICQALMRKDGVTHGDVASMIEELRPPEEDGRSFD